MKITDIDKNFVQKSADESSQWISWKSEPFKLYGVRYDQERQLFYRLPSSIASQLSAAIQTLCLETSGGRLAFRTNSKKLGLKCIIPCNWIMQHMPLTGSSGFSVYVDGKFRAKAAPVWTDYIDAKDSEFTTEIILGENEEIKNVTLYFPLYSKVKDVSISLDNNCQLLPPNEYTYKKPIVFYGSSITQGGCASRPGNDYAAHVARWLDADYINLGFSGNAKGEQLMAEYVGSLDASVIVMDYDHNAYEQNQLEQTHYPFYKTIRKANKNVPIIFVSRPDYYANEAQNSKRRDFIKGNYLRSVQEGDQNTAFVDGQTLFGKEDYDACTVDGAHPNDLGFYRMAKGIYPAVKKFIEKQNDK